MTGTPDEVAAERLIAYLKREVLRRNDIPVRVDTPLVSSGLIDSLALVDVLRAVEDVTETRIPASRVRPEDMDTVAGMLDVARRLGRRRA